MPLVSRTRATLRSAEFGFLGVVVYTRVQTPRRWGAPFSAGVLVLSDLVSRPLRTSCWIVGTRFLERVGRRVDGRAKAVRHGGTRPVDSRSVTSPATTGGGDLRLSCRARR